jgi:hypothetical protein
VSTKYVRMTGDLVRFGCSLRVDCTHCGSARTLTGYAAVKGLGMVPIKGSAQNASAVCGAE